MQRELDVSLPLMGMASNWHNLSTPLVAAIAQFCAFCFHLLQDHLPDDP